jgi:hypothetical protein
VAGVIFLNHLNLNYIAIEKKLHLNKCQHNFICLISSLNQYYEFISKTFIEWIYDSDGLANIIKWDRNYFSVFSHFYQMTHEVQSLSSEVRKSAAQSNVFILDTMQEVCRIFETGKYINAKFSDLTGYRENIKKKHDQYRRQIVNAVKIVNQIAEYQRLRQLIRF